MGSMPSWLFEQIKSSKFLKKKKSQIDKKYRQCRGCCRRRCTESPGAKPPMQLPSRRLWLHLSRFSSQKVLYCHPRAGFCERTMTQTTPQPHSAYKWWRNKKNNLPAFLFAKYCHGEHCSVSDRWNQSWQTFCCPRAASWRTWRGSSKPSAKTSPPPTYGGRWAAAESSPKSALTKPKKVPK